MSRENGQTLPMALILVTLAMLLAAFIIPKFHVISRSYASKEKHLKAYYAAEGAIDVVLTDLAHGADASSKGYKVPNVTINGFTPDITISVPKAGNPPDSTESFFDPNTSDAELKQLQPGTGYLLRLQDIHPRHMEINWAYHPAGLTRIGIWRGKTALKPGRISSWPDEEPVQISTSTGSSNHLSLAVSAPGTYDVVFFNPLWRKKGGRQRPNKEKATVPFEDSTNRSHTWIYADSHRDYIIESSADDMRVKAYVRQIPGLISPPVSWSRENPGQIPREVRILSWLQR